MVGISWYMEMEVLRLSHQVTWMACRFGQETPRPPRRRGVMNELDVNTYRLNTAQARRS